MGAAACCVSYSFTEDPEGRSCSLGPKPSWPMFAASASVYSIQQTLLHSLLVPGYVPGAYPALEGLPGWWGCGQVGLYRAGEVRPRSRGSCAGEEAY